MIYRTEVAYSIQGMLNSLPFQIRKSFSNAKRRVMGLTLDFETHIAAICDFPDSRTIGSFVYPRNTLVVVGRSRYFNEPFPMLWQGPWLFQESDPHNDRGGQLHHNLEEA